MEKKALTYSGGVILVVLFSFTASFFFISGISYTLSFLSILLVVYIAIMLYRSLTKTNAKINAFFSALKNKDVSAYIPLDGLSGIEKELATEMNVVAAIAGKQRKDTKEQSDYYEGVLDVMTHEISNAITPIASLSSVLLAENKKTGNAALQDDLTMINEQCKVLQTFLDAYHRLVHLPELQRQVINLNLFFARLERLLLQEPGCGNIYYPKDIPVEIDADPNLLTLAMLHLIRNALQAIGNRQDGRVVITVNSDYTTAIEVRDNGPGVPPDLQEAVFIPFFSTKKTGSGIGLSISRRIMQLHGGELLIRSSPGETVFTLQFNRC